MIVNTKFVDNLPNPTIHTFTDFLVSSDFQNVMEEYTNNSKRRFLIRNTVKGPLITIQHTGWFTRGHDPSYVMTMACVGTIGLLDTVLLSHEGTLETSLLWLFAPKARILKATESGVVLSASVPSSQSTASILSNTDGLLIMADQQRVSTAIIHSEFFGYDTY